MSGCTTTVPNSVRKSAPVGQTSRHAACGAVLADVGASSATRSCPSAGRLPLERHRLLDEGDVAPGGGARARRCCRRTSPVKPEAVVGHAGSTPCTRPRRPCSRCRRVVSVKKPDRARPRLARARHPVSRRRLSAVASPPARAAPARAACGPAGCRRSPPSTPGCGRSGRARAGTGRWPSRRVARPLRCPSGRAGRPGGRRGPRRAAARIRSVTSTRASIAARAVTIVAQPPCSRPRSAASSGLTSQNISGCSSAR